MLTAPLRLAVSGDVPAHSWVSAPWGVGYMNARFANLPGKPSKPVNNVVKCGKQQGDSLSRSKTSRIRSDPIIPIQREGVSRPYGIGFPRKPTRMDRGRYDFITVPPGQFLGEYDVPLEDRKALILKIRSMLVIVGLTNLL